MIKNPLNYADNELKTNLVIIQIFFNFQGEYCCMEKTCEIGIFKFNWNGEYNACSSNANSSLKLNICHKNFEARHNKIPFKLSIRGEKRLEQKKSIALNGLVNTQTFNKIYNENISDPSKLQ